MSKRRTLSALLSAVVGLTTAAGASTAAVPTTASGAAAAASPLAWEERPALAIGDVTLLRSKQRQLRLTRGVWTTVRVRVNNPGTGAVEDSSIRGGGRGVAVRTASVGYVSAGGETEAEVAVKLTGKATRTNLRLVVDGSEASAARTIPVRRVKQPKRPVAGRYRSPDGAVTFRVNKRGRVTGFRSRTEMQCGTWPQFTYQTQRWNFPKTAVPKSGVVHRWHRVRTSTRQDSRLLEFRMVGRKVTRGQFWYDGGYCTGTTWFTAKRAGK